jgi:aspartate aminotransferase-like enzyme
MMRKRHQLERLNQALEGMGFQRFVEGECSQITATYHYSEEQQKTFDTLMRHLKTGNIHLLQNPISQRQQRIFQCSTMGWISSQQLDMTVNRISRLGRKLYSV